jgi:hypothetical protein
MHFLWLALLVATSLAERAADGADVLAPIDIDGELGFPDTEVDDEDDISDSDKEDDMLRRPLDIPKLEAGNLPITKVFTRAGLDAAANSAGCGNKPEWRSRLAAVHDLVAHTYILTLPRPAKVDAATDTAERCVSSRAQQRPPQSAWRRAPSYNLHRP